MQQVLEDDCTKYDLQTFKLSVQDQSFSLESGKIQNNCYNLTLEKLDRIISWFDRLTEFQKVANKTRQKLDLRISEKKFFEMADDLTEIVHSVLTIKISFYPLHMEEFIEKCNELERTLRVLPFHISDYKISQYKWLVNLILNCDRDS